MNNVKKVHRKIKKENEGGIPYTTFVNVARKKNFSIDQNRQVLTTQTQEFCRKSHIL